VASRSPTTRTGLILHSRAFGESCWVDFLLEHGTMSILHSGTARDT
jgi:recombinational DNA repair protein (RecF pathway)